MKKILCVLLSLVMVLSFAVIGGRYSFERRKIKFGASFGA